MKTPLITSVASFALAFPLLAGAAPAVGGDITITNNTAGKVTVIGGRASGGVGPLKGELNMTSAAYVNSAVVNGGSVAGKITVSNNRTKDVLAIGGVAAVNSVVVNAK
ncbi:hypothetical protein [Accumulibacter sp.]|uniref:hypothetical protein n=1 Tax=Accumulibacter sp. TaxID=2053492 RepID=UPI002617E4EC|nr:hypothetical protein [Accumulibacter sp.]